MTTCTSNTVSAKLLPSAYGALCVWLPVWSRACVRWRRGVHALPPCVRYCVLAYRFMSRLSSDVEASRAGLRDTLSRQQRESKELAHKWEMRRLAQERQQYVGVAPATVLGWARHCTCAVCNLLWHATRRMILLKRQAAKRRQREVEMQRLLDEEAKLARAMAGSTSPSSKSPTSKQKLSRAVGGVKAAGAFMSAAGLSPTSGVASRRSPSPRRAGGSPTSSSKHTRGDASVTSLRATRSMHQLGRQSPDSKAASGPRQATPMPVTAQGVPLSGAHYREQLRRERLMELGGGGSEGSDSMFSPMRQPDGLPPALAAALGSGAEQTRKPLVRVSPAGRSLRSTASAAQLRRREPHRGGRRHGELQPSQASPSNERWGSGTSPTNRSPDAFPGGELHSPLAQGGKTLSRRSKTFYYAWSSPKSTTPSSRLSPQARQRDRSRRISEPPTYPPLAGRSRHGRPHTVGATSPLSVFPTDTLARADGLKRALVTRPDFVAEHVTSPANSRSRRRSAASTTVSTARSRRSTRGSNAFSSAGADVARSPVSANVMRGSGMGYSTAGERRK